MSRLCCKQILLSITLDLRHTVCGILCQPQRCFCPAGCGPLLCWC